MTMQGAVQFHELGKSALSFPEGSTWGSIRCYPGKECDPERYLITIYAITLCHRIAPWMSVVVAHRLVRDDEREVAGSCCDDLRAIFLSLTVPMSMIPVVACHKA